MKKWFIKYFNFTKTEFNGLIVLFCLLLLLQLAPYFYRKFIYRPILFPIDKNAIQELELLPKQGDAPGLKKSFKRNATNKDSLFYFDPNTTDLFTFKRLGFSTKQAQSILNFRAKGGRFKSKADFKKLYVVNENMYQRLFSFIQIDTGLFPVQKVQTPAARPLPLIELNGADSLALMQLKGIGPVFAARIIKYRERLGGFVDPTQLLEVYGIDSTVLALFRVQLRIDSNAIRKISINEVDFEAFKSFPYLSYRQMKSIIAYRRQHGPYQSAADLAKVGSLNTELINKIRPYLNF